MRNGDRVLILPPGNQNSTKGLGEFPCVKLEYLHGQHHHQQHRARKPKSLLADNQNETGEMPEKPRLLSVKSPDIKSYDKKRIQHSTSAAEAPTDDGAVKNTEKGAAEHNADADKRKAGEDWSAVGSPKKGQEAIVVNEDGKQEKEDDDNMEEYSYLTGEVMVKDQDYISAITGDDATSPSAMQPDEAEDGEYREEEYEEGDAATASAVVLGATTPPSKPAARKSRELKDDVKKDGNMEKEERAPLPEAGHEDMGAGGRGEQKLSSPGENKNKVEFAEDTAALLAAPQDEQKSESDEDENNSEEELLSQPDDGECSPPKLEISEVKKDGDNDKSDDDSGTDIEKTQPFQFSRKEKASSVESLATGEEGKDDDSDSATECPSDLDDDQKMAADDNEAEKVADPGSPAQKVGGTDEHDSDNLSGKCQATQAFPSIAVNGHDDADINNNDAADTKEAEKAGPASPNKLNGLSQTAENDKAEENDSDDLSVKEPTQNFPPSEPLGDVNKRNESEGDDDAFQVETQNDDAVWGEETQAFISQPEADSAANALESGDKLDAGLETPKNHINEEKNSLAAQRISSPQTDLKEAEDKLDTGANVDEEGDQGKLPAKSATQVNEAEKNTDMTKSPEPAAKPPVVHFALDTKTSEVPQQEGQEKGEENEPESMKLPPSPAKEPQQVSERRSPLNRTTYDDSAIQKQRLENSAVHRVSSGAIMTGPVGGANPFPTSTFPTPKEGSKEEKKQAEPKNNLLVSIARAQSNNLDSNPLPDAAASSEETTVCQADSTELNKEQGLTADNGPVEDGEHNGKVVHSALQEEEEEEEVLDERNDYAQSRDRDPNIPGSIEVCLNKRGGHGRHSNKGLTSPHHRSKRKRGVSSSGRRRDGSGDVVRIMFTGINPTRRHKQMIDDIGAQLVDSVDDALTATRE